MKTVKAILFLFLLLVAGSVFAQEAKTDQAFSIDLAELPEYVIILSENTGRLIGKKIINIDYKGSKHASVLAELEDILTDKKKLGIQNQTDLLNAMSNIGFDYLDTFLVGQGDFVKMVFRKKKADLD